jgi:hypothetical protein
VAAHDFPGMIAQRRANGSNAQGDILHADYIPLTSCEGDIL